jgi:hypothetical protein
MPRRAMAILTLALCLVTACDAGASVTAAIASSDRR